MSKNKRKKGGAHLQPKVRGPKENIPAQKQIQQKVQKQVQEKKKVRTRKEKIKLAVILTLIILLALLVTGFAVVFAIHQTVVKRPELPSLPSNSEEEDDFIVDGVKVGGDRKEDYFTFLVIGRDTGGGGNTDTILLAAYDIANQELNVMSIPRDTMVNVSWDLKKINSVYNSYGGGDKGIQALYKEVSQLVGFIPDYEVVIEWEAVGELVNAIGGVWFDVPRDMNYDDPTQNLHIHISKGYQKLNGEDAMGVIRWRKNNNGGGYDTGDIGRIETQQAFLKAVIQQCLTIQNATKIQTFANIFTENVQTDLTVGNLVWFAEQAIFGGLKMNHVNFITMPGDYTAEAWSYTQKNMQSYVTPDAEELLKVINESFNPYLEDRTAEGLDIMSINADGTLSSSTGIVEDTRAAGKSSGSSSTTTKPTTTPRPSASSTPAPSTSHPPASTPSPNPRTSENPSTSSQPAVSEPPSSVSAPSGNTEGPFVTVEPTPSPPPEEPPVNTGEEQENPVDGEEGSSVQASETVGEDAA